MNETKTQPAHTKSEHLKPVLITCLVLVAALLLVWIAYSRFINHPWTRDGQIRADIIGITSEVSGKIVKIHVKGEQEVQAGQLLFEIDPSTGARFMLQPFHLKLGSAI